MAAAQHDREGTEAAGTGQSLTSQAPVGSNPAAVHIHETGMARVFAGGQSSQGIKQRHVNTFSRILFDPNLHPETL